MGWATLNGTILDDGGVGCEARFQYGTTLAMGSFTPWYGDSLLVTGDTFAQPILGLSGGTIYFFRAEVRNSIGVGTPGALATFQTSLFGGGIFIPPPGGWPPVIIPPPPGGGGGGGGGGSILTPVVDILTPTLVTASIATLNGVLTFQGDLQGDVRFQWGASASYGMTTPWQSGFGTGTSFSALITGLGQGGAYHCRAEFKNSHGPPVVSGDLTFSTLSETGGMVLVGDDILVIIGGEQ